MNLRKGRALVGGEVGEKPNRQSQRPAENDGGLTHGSVGAHLICCTYIAALLMLLLAGPAPSRECCRAWYLRGRLDTCIHMRGVVREVRTAAVRTTVCTTVVCTYVSCRLLLLCWCTCCTYLMVYALYVPGIEEGNKSGTAVYLLRRNPWPRNGVRPISCA